MNRWSQLTLTRRAPRTLQANISHESFHRAACHVDVLSTQMHPHLPRPVDRIVLLVLDRDTLLQLFVADGTFRRFPAEGLIECRRGKLAAELSQLGANRLDPES